MVTLIISLVSLVPIAAIVTVVARHVTKPSFVIDDGIWLEPGFNISPHYSRINVAVTTKPAEIYFLYLAVAAKGRTKYWRPAKNVELCAQGAKKKIDGTFEDVKFWHPQNLPWTVEETCTCSQIQEEFRNCQLCYITRIKIRGKDIVACHISVDFRTFQSNHNTLPRLMVPI